MRAEERMLCQSEMSIAENMLHAKKALEKLSSLRNLKKASLENKKEEHRRITADIREYSN